jgi:Co/Zn/Cd efflux system component
MRAEVVGAMVNSVFLASLCLTIGIEAIKRFIAVQEIEKVDLLLYVASLGLLINLIGLAIFGHGHSHGHSHGTDVKVSNNQQSNLELGLLKDSKPTENETISKAIKPKGMHMTPSRW